MEKYKCGKDILVVAEFLPGDESINFTSPYAGGNFSCITGDDEDTMHYDKYTYQNLARLMKLIGGAQKGLDFCYSTEYWDSKPSKAKLDSLSSYLLEYQVIEAKDLPEGSAYGIKFKSFSFNCPIFLQNVKIYLEQQGVTFKRKKLTHIVQAYMPGTKAVFNCTALGSFKLSGVSDTNVYPTRGQVLVVHAPHITQNTMRWGEDYATYIIKRPHSGDQLILGGFLQKDWWCNDTFGEQNEDILRRTTALVPEIVTKNPYGPRLEDLKIIRAAAGLRPSRYGGARIEKEIIDGKTLIHNYGASGYGYQAGYGMAARAVSLLKEGKL